MVPLIFHALRANNVSCDLEREFAICQVSLISIKKSDRVTQIMKKIGDGICLLTRIGRYNELDFLSEIKKYMNII